MAHIASRKVGREKMRYILMLALFFTCLPAASAADEPTTPAASAADDPITKRNNDASTPVLIKSQSMQPVPWSRIERIRGRRGN